MGKLILRSKTDVDIRISALNKQRVQMREYCQMKLDCEDFHGVADAAMDLREIIAELSALTAITPYLVVASSSGVSKEDLEGPGQLKKRTL